MTTDERHGANPGYALEQLLRALNTAQFHDDPEIRSQAENKAERWSAVLAGMASGTLLVGSRTPVAETPPWVTLEVVHGGFATGRFLAEGPLCDHEAHMLAALPSDTPGSTERERLNLFFCSDAGRAQLHAALAEGRYAVELPEESALMVVAWLVANDHTTHALELVTELRPLMHRLRFYPRLTANAQASGAGVHLSTAGAVTKQLLETRTSAQVTTMNATLAVWNPLYDALVSLWLRTVDGDTPRLQTTAGELVRNANGDPIAVGGSPCRVWPSDWWAVREAWLVRYTAAVTQHGAAGRHHRAKSNFQLLLRLLERCPSDPSTVTEVYVHAVRHTLACAVHKHGVPSEAPAKARRAEQAAIAARPLHSDIAQVLAARLAKFPADDGIPSVQAVAHTVADGEHARVPAGTDLPARFLHKIERALLASVDELVELGVVGSAEVLAIVLPQLTAQVAAAGLHDPTCRDLFARTYSAFRRRRSLLLLNLEHQVTIDELPWIAALASFRRDDVGTAGLASQTLRDVTLLMFEHFPHTIVPNPLLREFASLSTQAGLALPFVEEIAADIFMGTFTKKFGDAATLANQLLAGTLYDRYFDLSTDRAPQRSFLSRWGKKTDATFDARCAKRAEEAGSEGGRVAASGAVLEQCQILTSYNLAALVVGLELYPELQARGAAVATKALRRALEIHQRLPNEHLPRLRATKNAAYAWRQAIFFLSFVDAEQQRSIVAEVTSAFASAAPEAMLRLAPAIDGLHLCIDNGRFDVRGRGPAGQRRYLGWARGPHWLLPEPAARGR